MKYINTLFSALILSTISTSSLANQLTPEFVLNEIDVAQKHYMCDSPETAKSALQTLARLLESDQSLALLDKIGPDNLAITYARLGLVYENSGDNLKASDYKAKAVSLMQRHLSEIDWEGMKQLIQFFDSNLKKRDDSVKCS
ncbi:hypothetical protein ACFFK7_17580 [Pseudoalteromonas xiamenensis]|uniref:hypothetical protein n=1 Tax=Pseudoalteromonas xiamenensis TaxID=882626 RepID=UPI0035EF1740